MHYLLTYFLHIFDVLSGRPRWSLGHKCMASVVRMVLLAGALMVPAILLFAVPVALSATSGQELADDHTQDFLTTPLVPVSGIEEGGMGGVEELMAGGSDAYAELFGVNQQNNLQQNNPGVTNAQNKERWLAQSSRRRRGGQRKSSDKAGSQRKSRRARSSSGGGAERQRVISSEKRYSQSGVNKDTNIDFDEIDITGQRKDPGVGFVRTTVTKRGRDFVNIRREWHDAVVQSTLLVE